MINFRIRSERIQARVVGIRMRVALIRAAWLALVPILGFVLATIIRPDVRLSVWPWFAAGALVFVAGAGLGRRQRAESDVIRELDRKLGLGELLVTAAEVDRRGARTTLEKRLLDDGAAAIARFGGERAISDRPVRIEREALIGVCLIIFGTLAVREALRLPPDPDRLPPIAILSSGAGPGDGSGPGSEPGTGGDGDGGGSGTTPGGRTPGLSPIAGAFTATAAGSETAAALNEGDARGAARALRSLADRAEELSPDGRKALGDALAKAAEDFGADGSELAEAARSASDALRAEDDSASEGLSALASALDAAASRGLADSPPPSIREREGPPLDRLQGAGATSNDALNSRARRGAVERSAAGRGGAPDGDSPIGQRRAGSTAPSASDGGTSGFGGKLSPEQRPIVLRYFASQREAAP